MIYYAHTKYIKYLNIENIKQPSSWYNGVMKTRTMNARASIIRNGKHQSHTFIGLGPVVNLVMIMVIPIFTGIIQIETLAILPFGTPEI